MKSQKEMRKPAKDAYAGTEDLKKSRKLKPLKKEKNQKRIIFEEIDDLEDLDMAYKDDDLDEDNFLYDDDELD